MTFRFFSFLSLALAVCLSTSVIAQDQEGGRGGRGGRGGGGFGGGGFGGGGFGGGFGGGMMRGGAMGGGAMELLRLLPIEGVAKDIGLDEESLEAIQTAQRDLMGDMRGLRDLSEDERAEKMTEMMKKMNDGAKELLNELSPEQQKRLMGLLVQRDGNRAAMNELVAKEIDLGEEDLKKVREAVGKVTAEMGEKMAALRTGGDGERPDFTKMREMMEESNKDMEKAVTENLTKEHIAALEAMKGEKFEFPAVQGFGGRGGPGGGRGGPGGGGRGGRPGQN